MKCYQHDTDLVHLDSISFQFIIYVCLFFKYMGATSLSLVYCTQ